MTKPPTRLISWQSHNAQKARGSCRFGGAVVSVAITGPGCRATILAVDD
jgi:hypothetical protein